MNIWYFNGIKFANYSTYCTYFEESGTFVGKMPYSHLSTLLLIILLSTTHITNACEKMLFLPHSVVKKKYCDFKECLG